MLSLNQVRNTFIEFFKKNNHKHIASSSLVPHNDPSLLFVNSGMVQFKNVFTGLETKDYTKATSSQKSLRAGGKHNDLENVGFTARHHTFFEMLGNFSFGDYFKEQAIYYAWKLLTEEYCLDKNKLYATIYHDDDEAATYWKKIAGFSDDRIIRISTNDNFWSMGDLGPCGPCSEIFYDHGDKIFGGLPGTKDEGGDRYIEIWNMVFMQYEQTAKDTRILLPKKSVDTGMGLERITAVLQNVHDNYEIDIFQNIINFCETLIKVPASGKNMPYYKVIADHLRAIIFLIADSVMPSNEGRGYVLRRIIRRAIRYVHFLGYKDLLLYQASSYVISLMESAYPELKRAESLILSIIQQEEIKFLETIDRGIKFLDQQISASSSKVFSGVDAFKLYDTYGFPLDITADILKSHKIEIDYAQFDAKMLEQKQRAKQHWLGSGDSKIGQLWFDIYQNYGATEFLGYEQNIAEGKVIALIANGSIVNEYNVIQQKFYIITNQTCFYGESGGQMGDIGYIESAHGKIKITDTKKFLGTVIAHEGILESGNITVGDNVTLTIDVNYRQSLRINHTATHLLHNALHQVLGSHVTQKGSLVSANKLRFDFNHHSALSEEQLLEIENIVNKVILQNIELSTQILPYEKALSQGAIGLFGEKYEEDVRVVTIQSNIDSYIWSKELCGGTHAKHTGDLGSFKIISEFGVASGIRRIEALVGLDAFNLAQNNDLLINKIASKLKSNKNSEDISQKIDDLILTKKKLEQDLSNLLISGAMVKESMFQLNVTNVDPKIFFHIFDNYDAKALKKAAELFLNTNPNSIVIYGNKQQANLSIMINIGKVTSEKTKAIVIAQQIAQLYTCKSCGGNEVFAQLSMANIQDLEGLKRTILSCII